MINRIQNTIEDPLSQRLSTIQRELNALKTRQLSGGDNIVVEVLETMTTFTLIENTQNTQLVSIPETAVDANPFYTDFGFLLYINNDDDANYLWPNGSSLNALYGSGNPIQIHWRRDLAASDDSIGKRVFLFYLLYRAQYAIPTITAYLHTKLYTPKKLFV